MDLLEECLTESMNNIVRLTQSESEKFYSKYGGMLDKALRKLDGDTRVQLSEVDVD